MWGRAPGLNPLNDFLTPPAGCTSKPNWFDDFAFRYETPYSSRRNIETSVSRNDSEFMTCLRLSVGAWCGCHVALLEFSQCMRDNGIDIPDIGLDEAGGPDLSDPAYQQVDIESREFSDALDTCQPILSRVEAFRFAFDPAFQAEINDNLLAIAGCMRENGYEDFPDPTGLLVAPFPPELAEQIENDPAMQEQAQACATQVFGGAPPGGPGGPGGARP